VIFQALRDHVISSAPDLLHGSIQKPDRCIAEHGASTPMYPKRTHFFLEAFAQSTSRPHGYMVIDMKQNTTDILRLRTFIFPGEEQKAYVES
jgi:hypothetical protein